MRLLQFPCLGKVRYSCRQNCSARAVTASRAPDTGRQPERPWAASSASGQVAPDQPSAHGRFSKGLVSIAAAAVLTINNVAPTADAGTADADLKLNEWELGLKYRALTRNEYRRTVAQLGRSGGHGSAGGGEHQLISSIMTIATLQNVVSSISVSRSPSFFFKRLAIEAADHTNVHQNSSCVAKRLLS